MSYKSACFYLLLILLGFASGVMVAISVMFTLYECGGDTNFLKSKLYISVIVAGATGAFMMMMYLIAFHVSKRSTKGNADDNDDKQVFI
jgi:hypothetical protein